MDSDFCTYTVHFRYRWMISAILLLPSPAWLENSPPHGPCFVLVLSFCCGRPVWPKTPYSAPIFWCIRGSLGTRVSGEFICHGLGARTLKRLKRVIAESTYCCTRPLSSFSRSGPGSSNTIFSFHPTSYSQASCSKSLDKKVVVSSGCGRITCLTLGIFQRPDLSFCRTLINV